MIEFAPYAPALLSVLAAWAGILLAAPYGRGAKGGLSHGALCGHCRGSYRGY
jgi:hypothetical protein